VATRYISGISTFHFGISLLCPLTGTELRWRIRIEMRRYIPFCTLHSVHDLGDFIQAHRETDRFFAAFSLRKLTVASALVFFISLAFSIHNKLYQFHFLRTVFSTHSPITLGTFSSINLIFISCVFTSSLSLGVPSHPDQRGTITQCDSCRKHRSLT
jgi:hypothetical protein